MPIEALSPAGFDASTPGRAGTTPAHSRARRGLPSPPPRHRLHGPPPAARPRLRIAVAGRHGAAGPGQPEGAAIRPAAQVAPRPHGLRGARPRPCLAPLLAAACSRSGGPVRAAAAPRQARGGRRGCARGGQGAEAGLGVRDGWPSRRRAAEGAFVPAPGSRQRGSEWAGERAAGAGTSPVLGRGEPGWV